MNMMNTDQHIIQRSECNLNEAHSTNNGTIISNPTDQLNVIGAYFETINAPRYLSIGTRIQEFIIDKTKELKEKFTNERQNEITITQFSETNKSIEPSAESETCSHFCNQHQIDKIINKLPNKTSFGIDKIPNVILKRLPSKITHDYTILLNNCINHSYFPSTWKTAKILPLLKNDKPPNKPSSYRPISLLPTITKVYEAIINNAIVSNCDKNNIIPNTQFGFRRKHSTTHAINKLLSDLNIELSQNKLVGATLIDLEKAFDTVWHNGLIYKLMKKNPYIPHKINIHHININI
uniref:Reverse transcriptase domain-containing protein n=1 Tax=Bracon brevicornis TaxID=1563983 RepID=A0A6V7JW55_9HYME